MTEKARSSDLPTLAELVVSAERHRHLDNILSYVKAIHHGIDPDMYRISNEKLDHFAWCFESEAFEHTGFTMTVSWEDLLALETIVDAAYTYSMRRSQRTRVEGLTDLGFDDLLKWLARAEDELFRSKSEAR